MEESLVASKLDFVKTTLDPYNYQVVPPNIHNYTTIVKELTVYLNQTIGTATPVPETSGVITWFVQRGVGSIVRWGQVPSGFARGYLCFPLWFGNGSTQTISYTLGDTLWLPYDRLGQPTVSPNLSEQFSFVRPFAGQVSLYSSTISTTNASLSGTVAITTLTDFRDALVAGQGLEVTTLVQQAVTKKDGIANVPVYDGVTSVLGSDIPTDFTPPDPSRVVVYRDGIGGPLDTVELVNYNSTIPFLIYGGEVCTASYFFTPYNFTTVTSGTLPRDGPANSTIVRIPLQSPFMEAVPEIEMRMPTTNVAPTFSGAVTQGYIRLRVVTFNVYAHVSTGTIASTNNCSYTYSRPNAMYIIRCDQAINNDEYQIQSRLFDFSHGAGAGIDTAEPQDATIAGMQETRGGIYIGTHVYVYCENFYNSPVGTGLTNVNAMAALVRVRMHARALYSQGNLGPVRVIRYDTLEAGQTLNVTGRLLCECVPTGVLAPYVTPSSLTDRMSMAVGLLPFISMLYNGKSPFRRNWTRSEYQRLCEQVVPSLSVSNLVQWDDVPDEVVRAAQAAGLFDTLGGIGGAMLGGKLGNPALGQALGSALGGMLGSKLGLSAGMYGSASQIAQARADYGHSAGMYGQCAGMYASGTYPISGSNPLKRIRKF